MKNLALILFIIVSPALLAQDFEGSIAWDIKTTIKDPKIKAQMEQAQKQLKDPATLKQMKEMKEQMNNPQMKAMMESNPQMKAQMEKMMEIAEGGDVNDMIPKSMMVKIKNGNSLSKMEGGLMGGETLYLKEKGVSYHLDKKNKTYSVLGKNDDASTASKGKVTRTGESQKILGYTCYRYKVEIQEDGKAITQWIWATPDIKGIDMNGFSTADGKGNGPAAFYSEIEGVPLKMEMILPEMDMVMEATAVKKENLPASDFAIPSGFTEVKSMFGFR